MSGLYSCFILSNQIICQVVIEIKWELWLDNFTITIFTYVFYNVLDQQKPVKVLTFMYFCGIIDWNCKKCEFTL